MKTQKICDIYGKLDIASRCLTCAVASRMQRTVDHFRYGVTLTTCFLNIDLNFRSLTVSEMV